MMYLFLGRRHAIRLIAFVLTVLVALLGFWMAIATAQQITAGMNFPRRGRGPCARRIAGCKLSSWQKTVKCLAYMGGLPILDAVEER